MSSDTDTKPDTILGYEKKLPTGRNSIENYAENVKGIVVGPLIWLRGNTYIGQRTIIYLATFLLFLTLLIVCRKYREAQSKRLQLLP